MRKRGCIRSLLHAATAIAAAIVIGCDAGDSREALDLWTLGREGEVVARLVPGFERDHAEVDVQTQQIPWSAAHEKLLTAYVGEAMPDLFQVGNTWIPELVALGALEPLDDRLLRSTAMSREDFFPGVLDTNVIDGKLYGIPWYVDTRLLFYRRDLLAVVGSDTPPSTWEAWANAMERLKEHSPDTFAILVPLTEWQAPVIFALQRGGELLRENLTRGNFRSAEFRAAFSFYIDLFRNGLAPLAGQTALANVYQEFARGSFVFYVTGPWNLGEFERRLPKDLADRWATAPMPAPPNGTFPGVSVAGGASLVIHRGSKRKDRAWALVEYLCGRDASLELYRLTGDLPARKEAWRDPSLAANPRVQAFWRQLENVQPTPKVPEWERIASLISRWGEAAARGRVGIDEALEGLDRDVDQVLEKRRWMLARGDEP